MEGEGQRGDAAALSQIAEISRNARATWFGLIFVLLFCGVALLDVRDRDFFEYGAATQLPLLGVEVPVEGFFVTAPLVVLGLYIYLHVYLAKLWLELGRAPARPDGIALDRAVFPWLISDAALQLRKDVKPRPFGRIVSLASLVLGWLLGPVVIGAFWWRSWPYHHEMLTLYLSALLLVAVWIGWESWMSRRRMMLGGEAQPSWLRSLLCAPLGAAVLVVGWEATEGGIAARLPEGVKAWIEARHAEVFPRRLEASSRRLLDDRFKLDGMTFLYPANLAGAELVRIPDGWMGRDRAWREYRRRHGSDHAWETRDNPDTPDLETEFEDQRREHRAALDANSFARADLRKAALAGAFMAGADLEGARLERADLEGARLEGANLEEARLEGAKLGGARLEGARIGGAWLEGAYLRGARLEGANLTGARLKGANLGGAQMEGAYLGGAQLQGANLGGARLEGANLEGAELTEANLEGVRLEGAYLGGASLKSAKLASSTTDFADASFADFIDVTGMTQSMVDAMFGNAATTLPEGLVRPAQWPTESLNWRESRARYCAWIRTNDRDSRFCP